MFEPDDYLNASYGRLLKEYFKAFIFAFLTIPDIIRNFRPSALTECIDIFKMYPKVRMSNVYMYRMIRCSGLAMAIMTFLLVLFIVIFSVGGAAVVGALAGSLGAFGSVIAFIGVGAIIAQLIGVVITGLISSIIMMILCKFEYWVKGFFCFLFVIAVLPTCGALINIASSLLAGSMIIAGSLLLSALCSAAIALYEIDGLSQVGLD
jgi:hypothetical protein